jgi:DNA phosphorothioation-associated putative methyltransferase
MPGEADVVNLGYVVNVIETQDERNDVLKRAWNFTRDVLVVAARLSDEESREPGTPYGDGCVTRTGTFQKYFQQSELRDWITAQLGIVAVAAGPGVFYAFRNERTRESWLATRYRRVSRAPVVNQRLAIFEAHRADFEALMTFVAARGRLPDQSELPQAERLQQVAGSLTRAMRIIERVSPFDEWHRIRDERSQDLLVYIALSRFDRRPPWEALPNDVQLDVRAFFGSYRTACRLADELLFSLGNRDKRDATARTVAVGKVTPTAVYVHASALTHLPALLRVYEGCGRAYLGAVEGANVIKLYRDRPQVSYLQYPGFERDPHPSLLKAMSVDLQAFRVDYRDYAHSANPPILHRKELFVDGSHPLRERFERLTRQEERAGLYERPEHIGTRDGWSEMLITKGVELKGHRVVRMR